MIETIERLLADLNLAIGEAIPYGATYYALVRARVEVRESLQHAKNGD